MRRRPNRGVLIALEGIDGSGKSTLQRRLVRRWRNRTWTVATRREPSDPDLGRLAQQLAPKDPWASAMVFTLDRLIARPKLDTALAEHDVVLTDRTFYSTLAYQGSAVPAGVAARMHRLQRGVTVVPDRVVLLHLSPDEALKRVGARGRGRAPLERRRTLSRVDRAYRRLALEHRWLVVDGSRPAEFVAAEVDSALAPWIERRRARARPGR
ncbi:MAG: dTMP kinase [Thermoplasmata archaeon]|nr:dTMP kinase [Thermoplasmata archaeon]